MRFSASHAGVYRRKRVMEKISKLGLVLECLLIVDALAQITIKLITLWNMINNYPKRDADQMVFKI